MNHVHRQRGGSAASLLVIAAACWSVAAPSQTAAEETGFVPIFDGKTLDGWDGNPKFWKVEDGAITGQTTPDNKTAGNTFIVWRGGEPGDFELKLKVRIEGGNTGVQYRSFEVPDNKWVIGGYQADFEAGDTWSGVLYGERFGGIFAKRGQQTVVGADGKVRVVGSVGDDAEISRAIKKLEWNDYHIIARGYQFIHKINGVTTVEVTHEDEAKRRAKGLIALQLHAGPPMKVQFKDIRLKLLGAPPQGAARQHDGAKKIVFVSGKPSHGYGSHEHYAGCLLLAKYLGQALPHYEYEVHRHGWPNDWSAFDGADAVVIYCDGGGGHVVRPHREQFDRLMQDGVGLVCIHYGVEVPQGDDGNAFLDWIGGYFETHWSVNPHWDAEFTEFPDHPVANGLTPFQINDEWYYHMRFRPNMAGVTPILSAHPPQSTLQRRDGPHSGNPHVRAAVQRGDIQHLAWAAERPNGGRGFGFTGGHFHWNWGDDNFRKTVLNAIVWVAGGEVPAEGVETPTPDRGTLEENQDYPKPAADKQSAGPAAGRGGLRAASFRGATARSRPLHRGSLATRQQAEGLLGAERLVSTEGQDSDHDVSQALAGLDVGPGLEVQLFAAEPLLRNPANIDVDHRGRVWVCEIVNYRKHQGRRPEGDRIVILEDADGDGKAETEKVFYQGNDIDSPHGICVLGNRVIVSVGDKVIEFLDTDGDDRPDQRRDLFTGVSGKQHDHGIHAFVFGPDGRLYFNFGNMGQQLKDADGQPIVDLAGNTINSSRQPYQEGMVFRCNLDGSDVETLGWNFRNNWMVTVDSFGTLWQSDNDDDGNQGVRINYVMEFGNYGYKDELTGAGWQADRTGVHPEVPHRHWHVNDPGVVPNLLITGAGSPTGITVYEGDHLPEAFRNQVIHCDAGPNVVRAYPVSADRAGYRAEQIPILTGARDKWFRPSDVKIAPDGSLIIADWYDPGVGGHNAGDLERGRLFRVTRAGTGQEYRVPQFDFATAEGAVEALKNPNYAVRYLAWTALEAMGRNAEPALVRLANDPHPRLRARAYWLLGRLPEREEAYIQLALADTDPDLRVVAIRLARQLRQNVLAIVEQAAQDPSPRVRRELALALYGERSERAARLWAALALQHVPGDRWYLEALGIGARQNWDACFAAWLNEVGDQWNTPAGRDIVWRSRASEAVRLLVQLGYNDQADEAEQLRYRRAIELLNGEAREAADLLILEQAETGVE